MQLLEAFSGQPQDGAYGGVLFVGAQSALGVDLQHEKLPGRFVHTQVYAAVARAVSCEIVGQAQLFGSGADFRFGRQVTVERPFDATPGIVFIQTPVAVEGEKLLG